MHRAKALLPKILLLFPISNSDNVQDYMISEEKVAAEGVTGAECHPEENLINWVLPKDYSTEGDASVPKEC